MAKKRIQFPIEFSSEEDRSYYQKMARNAGFSSFKKFAISAMDEKIGKLRTPNEILKDSGVDTQDIATNDPNLYSSIIRAMSEFADQYHSWKKTNESGKISNLG